MSFSIQYNFLATDKFSATARKINASIDKVNSKVKKFNRSAVDFGKKFTARVTLPILAFAAAALKSRASVESFEIRLGVLLRSTEKAKDLMVELVEFTAKTPFQLAGVVKTAAQLLAFGFEAKKIRETLRILGDVAAGTGQSLGDIGLIFGQISAAGKLTGERLLQLAERGVPIQRVLAKITGIAGKNIPDAISKGLIKFTLVEKAFKKMTAEGGVFFKATLKQSEGLAGIFSTLKDNIFLSLASIGETLVETFDLKEKLKGLIGTIANLTDKFNKFVKTNPKLTKFLFIMSAILAVVFPLAIVIGTIGFAITSVVGAVSAGITIFAGLAAIIAGVVSIIGAIPLAIALAIGALILLVENFEKVKKAFTGFIDKFRGFGQRFGAGLLGVEQPGGVGAPGAPGAPGDQGRRLSGFLLNKESVSTVNVNINAPDGVVGSVTSKAIGKTNFNLGQNGRTAGNLAFAGV